MVLEYRRAGMQGGGWPGTSEDVTAALAAVLADPGLPDRSVLVGHSAGGHLVVWAASQPWGGRPVAVVASPAARPPHGHAQPWATAPSRLHGRRPRAAARVVRPRRPRPLTPGALVAILHGPMTTSSPSASRGPTRPAQRHTGPRPGRCAKSPAASTSGSSTPTTRRSGGPGYGPQARRLGWEP